jgi:hypothetical protein
MRLAIAVLFAASVSACTTAALDAAPSSPPASSTPDAPTSTEWSPIASTDPTELQAATTSDSTSYLSGTRGLKLVDAHGCLAVQYGDDDPVGLILSERDYELTSENTLLIVATNERFALGDAISFGPRSRSLEQALNDPKVQMPPNCLNLDEFMEVGR